MLNRQAVPPAPAAACARVVTGQCLGCPKCLRTGWLNDETGRKAKTD